MADTQPTNVLEAKPRFSPSFGRTPNGMAGRNAVNDLALRTAMPARAAQLKR